MPKILMLKYKNGYQPIRRRSTTEHRNFGQRKTVVRPRRFNLAKTGSGIGSVITLTATPASGSTFGGWFGACTGTATTCTVTLSQARSVSASFSAPAVTTYQYDANGNLSQITDPRNLSTDYAMDSLGNLRKQTSPDTGNTETNHDASGNLSTHTDARGKTASYSYDSLNRISQIVYDDQTVNYSWDNCINGINRLCSLSNFNLEE